jgi:hypothetical protein
MYKQGEGVKNSDLALPRGSIMERRGVKVVMRYEGLTEWPLPPDQVWCVNRFTPQ